MAMLLVGTVAHADEPTLNRLDALEVRESEKATEIVVRGSTPPTFTVFKLNDFGSSIVASTARTTGSLEGCAGSTFSMAGFMPFLLASSTFVMASCNALSSSASFNSSAARATLASASRLAAS